MNSIPDLRQSVPVVAADPRAPSGEVMLTLEAAAELMQCNIAYLAMLVDNDQLAGAWKGDGRRRIVPESAARAWMAQRDAGAKNADFRAAGEAAGMYDIPEEVYIEVLTRPDA